MADGSTFQWREDMSANFYDWAVFGYDGDVRPLLSMAQAAEEAVALVTVIEAGDTDPCVAGYQMAFTSNDVCGFIADDWIEADVTRHAMQVLQDGALRRLDYGHVSLVIERITPQDTAVADLLAFMREGRDALWLSDGETRTCRPAKGIGGAAGSLPDGHFWRRYRP